MYACKQNGLNDGGGPKADSIRQRVKKIAAEKILFKESDKQEDKKPEKPPPENPHAQRTDVAKIKNM